MLYFEPLKRNGYGFWASCISRLQQKSGRNSIHSFYFKIPSVPSTASAADIRLTANDCDIQSQPPRSYHLRQYDLPQHKDIAKIQHGLSDMRTIHLALDPSLHQKIRHLLLITVTGKRNTWKHRRPRTDSNPYVLLSFRVELVLFHLLRNFTSGIIQRVRWCS